MTKTQIQSYEFQIKDDDEKTFDNDAYMDGFKVSKDGKSNVDFEEALEYTSFGKFNYILILVCGLALMGCNIEGYSIGYILPSAECDLKLTTSMKGILSSSNFIGIMGSCCIWGYISDVRGRKNILTVTFLATFLTSIAAALVPSFWGFTILRFINGISVSGPSAITFAYFGEFHSKKYRSISMAIVSCFIALALMELPGLGWLLLPRKISMEFAGITINSWRLFMLINALPSLIVALVLFKLPESPKFLYHSGNMNGALEVLRKIYALNTGNSPDSFPVTSLESNKLLDEPQKAESNIFKVLWYQISPLFMVPHLKYTLTASLMQGAIFAVSSGLFLWYPDIINQLSRNSNENVSLTVCKALSFSPEKNNSGTDCNTVLDDEIFIQNLIIGAAYLVSYALWGVVVGVLGNRNVIVLCLSVSSTAIFVILFLQNKIAIDVLFVLLLTLPGICVAVINLIVVDIFPTYLCGMAVCMVMTAGRLGSIVSSSVVGVMLQWNCSVTFGLYGGSLLVCVLLLFLVFPKYTTQ